MLFLAPIASTVCSAVGGTIVRALLVGGACAAGGALALGAKAFTLAKTAKYAGAAYVGYRIGKRCRRKSANPNRDGQDRSDKPI